MHRALWENKLQVYYMYYKQVGKLMQNDSFVNH